MSSNLFEVESNRLFSESKIWQLNREYYDYKGISAFSDGTVPHNLTSNSLVGNTYAELIYGFLKDLGRKGKIEDTVYILELGAGHGRLAFHILRHLTKLVQGTELVLPKFCYVLSDIVEENLSFFLGHPQFRPYYESGLLEVSYFDAVDGKKIELRYAKKTIDPQQLSQPIIAIANYFFDSIPNELFQFKGDEISTCSLSITAEEDPKDLNPEEIVTSLKLNYHNGLLDVPVYDLPVANEILNSYKGVFSEAYVFFPEMAMRCIANLQNLSSEGLYLISMDKGFHELQDLASRVAPDVVAHGSFSIWVNYHALGAYCERMGGHVSFPSSSTFHLDLASMLFVADGATYSHTHEAYKKNVDDFGPDDLNTIKKMAYKNVATLSVQELIALYRMSAYDSSFFIKMMPRLKQLSTEVTVNERKRIAETMHSIWNMYFDMGEEYDLAYQMGGIYYDLGFYQPALDYFQHSARVQGYKADTYYNEILCYYQLRQDKLFSVTLREGKKAFPGFERFAALDKLDMS